MPGSAVRQMRRSPRPRDLHGWELGGRSNQKGYRLHAGPVDRESVADGLGLGDEIPLGPFTQLVLTDQRLESLAVIRNLEMS